VISDWEAEEVMVPLLLTLPPLIAEAALKVVDEKPQELTTSSTSVGKGSLASGLHVCSPGQRGVDRTILLVIIVVELADTGGALGELRAGTAGVADAIDFFTVTVDRVIAGASSVDHALAN
jgi:hypothetical protein